MFQPERSGTTGTNRSAQKSAAGSVPIARHGMRRPREWRSRSLHEAMSGSVTASHNRPAVASSVITLRITANESCVTKIGKTVSPDAGSSGGM